MFSIEKETRNLIKNGSYTYFDILLYNCYNTITYEIDLDKFNNALDNILDVYQTLFDFSLNMAGFQFIGLFLWHI